MDLDDTYAYVRRDAVCRATLNAEPDNPILVQFLSHII